MKMVLVPAGAVEIRGVRHAHVGQRIECRNVLGEVIFAFTIGSGVRAFPVAHQIPADVFEVA